MFRPSVPATANDNSVKVTLQCISRPRHGVAMSYPVRHLQLTVDSPSIVIGRASANDQKKIQAKSDNAFFECAVMSRKHAEIYLENGLYGDVMIRDPSSLHGTFINSNEKRMREPCALRNRDLVKFGEQVSRMSDVHQGIEVFVGITRPSIPDSQATITGASAVRSNTFKVPSESDDGQDPELCIDDDDVTPSDEEEALSILDAAQNPLPKSFLGNDVHSSGLSQRDPVVINDGDMADPTGLTSPDKAHPRRLSDAQREDFAQEDLIDLDSQDEFDSDIEYANDDCWRSQGSAEPSESESIASDAFPETSQTHLWSTGRSDGDISDFDYSDVEGSKPTAAGPRALQPTVVIPQSGLVLPTPVATNPVPADRTLPNSETLRKESSSNYRRYSPFTYLHFGSTIDVPKPLGFPVADIGEGTATDHVTCGSEQDHQVSLNGHFDPLLSAAQPEDEVNLDRTSQAPGETAYREIAVLPINSSVSGVSQTFEATVEAHTSYEPANEADSVVALESHGESKKRKRDELDEAEDEDSGNADADAETLSNAAQSAAMFHIKRHDSASQTTEVESADATNQSLVVTFPVPSLAAKTKQEEQSRPAKRTRTLSFSTALTAAAGAVAGCVGAVGFLMSPYAEALLA